MPHSTLSIISIYIFLCLKLTQCQRILWIHIAALSGRFGDSVEVLLLRLFWVDLLDILSDEFPVFLLLIEFPFLHLQVKAATVS